MADSKFLSKAIGLYFVIISLSMLINMAQFTRNINNLINDPQLMFVVGFLTLIIGLLLVLSHNIWKWHWSVMVTIISWLILIKAIAILIYPGYLNNLTMVFVQNTTFDYVAASIDLILGLVFCYFGFSKNQKQP